MPNHIDLEVLRGNVYFEQATLDRRYVWERIEPDGSVAEVIGGKWMDGLARYRLVDCAHREDYRKDDTCTFCGQQTEKHTATAARKTRKTTK